MPQNGVATVSLLVVALAGPLLACGDGDSPTAPTPTCSYSISPAASTHAADGGTGGVTVTASAGSCAWTAASAASWMTISSGASGTGSGSVGYSVTANTSPDTRSGTLTIAGQTHTVTQQGRAPTICTYEISPTRADVPVEETRGSFSVAAPGGCAWTATSNSSWLTVTEGSSGSGNGTVSFLATANAGTDGRLGVITVADKPFTVRQNPNTALCQYAVAPVDFNPCMPGSSVVATVTAPAGCTWTVAPNASWLTVPSGSSGSGTGTVTIAFTDNYDAPRDGIVMVRWPTPTAGQNIRIAQAGCQYAVSQSNFSIAAGGGSGTFNVIQASVPNTCGGPTQDRCVWSAISDVPWISVAGTMPRSGDDRVTFTVAANTSGAARVGRITVRDKVVVINQQ